MTERTGDELLAMPVRLHGIQLGRPVDLLLDRDARRVVGLDVLCGDGVHRFLPLPVGQLRDVIVDEDGQLVAAITDQKRVPFGDGLRVAPRRRTAA